MDTSKEVTYGWCHSKSDSSRWASAEAAIENARKYLAQGGKIVITKSILVIEKQDPPIKITELR